MSVQKRATARAHANIAFIKYWGNNDEELRLPANSSISMNLDGLYAETTVTWRNDLPHDQLVLNSKAETTGALQRVEHHLNTLRSRYGLQEKAVVESHNTFPTGVGIASSAAAFAALTTAAVYAANLDIDERELSTLARLGSGSAARSVPTGFAVWYAAQDHEDSYSESIAAPDYWDIVDVVAVVSSQHKAVGSSAGHRSAWTSDLQNARVQGAQARLNRVQTAILDRDFETFAEVVENDSNLMHAVMMTSKPPLFYWQPNSLALMEAVRAMRAEGLSVCYTLDAGPNVHCICKGTDAEEVARRLRLMNGVEDVLVAKVGQGAHIISSS